MADIKKILGKKSWTGRELGILELTNTAVMFRQALDGKEQQPIVEPAQLQKMISSISDRQQGQVYNGYISIHEWLSIRFNMAQTHLQQAQLQYRTLEGYIERAALAEDVYHYIEQLPAIMTQKQYDDTRAERIEASFKDEAGAERHCNVFSLIEQAITYYLRLLQKNPTSPNLLKEIRKMYISQPVKSRLILSRWNEITGEGYYTLPDGRRSDQLSIEDWRSVLDQLNDEAGKTYNSKKKPQSGGAVGQLLIDRGVARATAIYNGATALEADEIASGLAGLGGVCTWHPKEDPPEDLTKWDVIEQELLLELYPADLDGSGDEYNEENFNRSMEDFAEEFRELVTAILRDMDKRYFKGKQELSGLPVEKWLTRGLNLRQLYEKDFYGARAIVEADTTIFSGNRRALWNGIAILREDDSLNHSSQIDENGYYMEPETKHTLAQYTLEGLFTEAEDYADNVEIVETARQTLIESYYFLIGYNYSLELIARFYDVPELTIFKMDTGGLEDKIGAFNGLVPVLYEKIHGTDYRDKELKAKKLQVLKDLFQPIDYEALTIPEENKEQAEQLLDGFRAFHPESRDLFNNLLCVLPQTDESGEGTN